LTDPSNEPVSGRESRGGGGPQNPAQAGILLIVTALLCAAIGFGLGSLAGGAVAGILAGVGGLIGLFLGFALVYSRFKDL
jgi:hypothetical protein